MPRDAPEHWWRFLGENPLFDGFGGDQRGFLQVTRGSGANSKQPLGERRRPYTVSLVFIRKWRFSSMSLLVGNFNPRDINHMPAVKIPTRLERDENISSLDGH